MDHCRGNGTKLKVILNGLGDKKQLWAKPLWFLLSLADLQGPGVRMCLDGPCGWGACRTSVCVSSSVHKVMCCCSCLPLIP